MRCQSTLSPELQVDSFEIENDLKDFNVVGQSRMMDQPVAIVKLVDANELLLVAHQAVELRQVTFLDKFLYEGVDLVRTLVLWLLAVGLDRIPT